uniref:Clathrin/coatomer adaptor adaptin-like N-terminal domain-containing protein n=1 Tax=Pavo cristatus TaxID=9049 RepID=A0A8C9EHR7_PAVCR
LCFPVAESLDFLCLYFAGGGSNPFQHLEKSAVLQEARVFNETPINPRKCAHILTKILYLINQGEHLGVMEATESFFAMTKLFQSNDVSLFVVLRCIYLARRVVSSVFFSLKMSFYAISLPGATDLTGKSRMKV